MFLNKWMIEKNRKNIILVVLVILLEIFIYMFVFFLDFEIFKDKNQILVILGIFYVQYIFIIQNLFSEFIYLKDIYLVF